MKSDEQPAYGPKGMADLFNAAGKYLMLTYCLHFVRSLVTAAEVEIACPSLLQISRNINTTQANKNLIQFPYLKITA